MIEQRSKGVVRPGKHKMAAVVESDPLADYSTCSTTTYPTRSNSEADPAQSLGISTLQVLDTPSQARNHPSRVGPPLTASLTSKSRLRDQTPVVRVIMSMAEMARREVDLGYPSPHSRSQSGSRLGFSLPPISISVGEPPHRPFDGPSSLRWILDDSGPKKRVATSGQGGEEEISEDTGDKSEKVHDEGHDEVFDEP